MDIKDALFLTHLRKNARETLTIISKRTNIPISTLYDRLKAHEKTIITKHTTLINFTKIGYLCKANIAIKTDIKDRDTIKDFLMTQNAVNSLYKINNGYDFLIEGIFKHIKEMEDFVENIERKFNIKEKNVHYIIEDLKREGFLSEPELTKSGII
jgi:DNA-binding Lrp family transcriptional regulator